MFRVANFIAFCYLLFTFGYIFSVGFYHVGELIILLFVLFLLFVFYLKPEAVNCLSISNDEKSFTFTLTLILIVFVALVGAKLGDPAQTNWIFYSAVNRILAGVALILSFTYLLKRLPSVLKRYRFWLLFIIAIIIRTFSIVSAPNPTIDVFHLLKDGPRLLLKFQNPYQMEYPAPYGVYNPTIIFVYGALTPFVFLPSDVIFNDPRYTLIFFDILSVFLLYKIGKMQKVPQKILTLIVAIFIFHPLFPFMTEQSWVEPLIFSFLLASIYWRIKKPKSTLPAIPLGAILAIKAVYLLPLLVFLKNQKVNLCNYLILVLTPLLISLPFLLLDKDLFLKRILFDSGAIQSYPRLTNASLNLSAVVLKYFDLVIPAFFVIVASLLFALILIKNRIYNLANTVLSLFLIFFFMFMLAPYVVLNYFSLLGNILLLSLLASLSRR